MKKSNIFQTVLFAALVSLSLISFSCSSGSNVGDVVCDYGSVLCDVSAGLCHNIPNVPPVVCDYLDLACINLNTLCDLRDSTDTPKFKAALVNIEDITQKLRQWHLAQGFKK